VACQDCGARVETGETWNEGQLWNRRAASAQQSEEIEALKHDLDLHIQIASDAMSYPAQEQRHPEDRTIFVLQEIARGRCDNGRPLSGETARNMARSALDFWPGKNAPERTNE
jgi:hypothetical protein